ncbi:MAG TPA: acyl-CoA dehydrogenase [Bdellovibrionales bacterium]|nr:acyl-CoA dehydrogenase [Bdellovibrionales bacterium]HCM40718.1 acyl-CoA dehydrogenase [Bdellovibrionales bacterium]
MLMEAVCAFAKSEIAPKAAEIDRNHRFPSEIVKQLGEMGLMGMMVPEEFGGAGMDAVSYAMALEEVSAACASTGVIMSVNNSLVCYPLLAYGNDKQKQIFLAPVARGEKLGCFALSEPGHGSDPGGLKCTVTKVPGGYKLNGSKNFITNGKEADYAIVFATLDRSLGSKGISAFIVDTKAQGFQVAKLEDKLGITGSSTAALFFDNVFVPEDCLLGKEGQGFRIALSTLDGGRIGIAAQALGIAKCALGASVKFANEREQFGAPIAKLQAIQWFIADMSTRLQGARLLTWNAAKKKDQGLRYTKDAAMAKLSASEAAMWIATKAIQVHGGYGFTKDYMVERNFRDAKITEIYEGTSEIQRIVIADSELNNRE